MSAFFFLFLLIIFLQICQVELLKICVTCCNSDWHKKIFKTKELANTLFSIPNSECSEQISQKTVKSTYPINSLKEKGFSPKTSMSFHLLKIYKHVMPSQTNVLTQKAAG